jgi:hypothetical protein
MGETRPRWRAVFGPHLRQSKLPDVPRWDVPFRESAFEIRQLSIGVIAA